MSDTPTPQDAPPAPAPASRSALFIVFLVVFIDLLGFGIVLPLMPLYATDLLLPLFPGDEPGRHLLRGGLLGTLMASFSFMQFLFAPVWGRLSDRIGRRPILLIGLFGSVVFYTLFGYAASLEPEHYAALAMVLFFIARIGAGVSGAAISTAQAVIADSTPPDKRKHGMALIGAAFGIGFTFGPLIGFGCVYLGKSHPDLAHLGYGLIGYTAAGMSFVALLLGLWLLPET